MKTIHRYFAGLLLVAGSISVPALADDNHHPSKPSAAAAKANAPFAEGEVRKIDVEQGKITLKHGPIDNLGMSAMTMVFRVSEASMLAKLKVGDKVKFKADRVNGAIIVTEIAPAK